MRDQEIFVVFYALHNVVKENLLVTAELIDHSKKRENEVVFIRVQITIISLLVLKAQTVKHL